MQVDISGWLSYTIRVGSAVKNQPEVQEMQVRSWVRKSPWRRAGKLLQDSCLENPVDREAWWL